MLYEDKHFTKKIRDPIFLKIGSLITQARLNNPVKNLYLIRMKPLFFETPAKFRKWLEKNHLTVDEQWVGFYKVGSGKPSITWPESVEQALCFGWIDGLRKSIDEESYRIRFTPRRPTSKWSRVNIQKVQELTDAGLMKPEGLAAFERRTNANYSFELEEAKFSPEYQKIFESNRKAWNYFQKQIPSYKKTATRWVLSAKQEETRLRRLTQLITDSEAEQYIKPLRRPGRS